MVRLVTTAPILSALEAIPPASRTELTLPESLTLGTPISHDQVIRISRYFRTTRSTHGDAVDRSLDSLLRGTKLYIPPPPPKPEPSPEYLAQKARLLAAAESDAYTRMLSPPSASSPSSPQIFDSTTSKLAALHGSHPSNSEDPNHTDPLTPSLVLNIFLSVLITGFSVYWALTSFQMPEILVSTISSTWSYRTASSQDRGARNGGGGLGASEPVRVLVSLFAALGVGVAEVSIYAIYLGKIEQARGKDGRVKERKEVVGREEVGRRGAQDRDQHLPAGTGTNVEKDKEVIWGRGPNGGLRRRVREKWEDEMDQDQDHGG
ncbi:endoplasmic reticulum-based factor for assembly of V-ATPase-domain-containing protein [Aspergillus aurantiobrunneus]